MASATIPTIETERLLLRCPAPGDVDAWAACIADPEFNRFMPNWDLSPHARAERKLTAFQRGWEQDPVSHIGWVITTKTDGGLVGLCDTDAVNGTSDGEVGYWMCQASWGARIHHRGGASGGPLRLRAHNVGPHGSSRHPGEYGVCSRARTPRIRTRAGDGLARLHAPERHARTRTALADTGDLHAAARPLRAR
jgi:Acetyltransferase (GNAT) domain